MQVERLSAAGQLVARAVASIDRQRERWPLWIPVFMAGGIGLYFALPSEPHPMIGPAALAAALAVWGLAWRVVALRRVALAFLALALTATGFLAAQARTNRAHTPILTREIGPVWVSGRLVKLKVGPSRTRLELDAVAIDSEPRVATPRRIRLSARTGQIPPGTKLGVRVVARAILRPMPAPAAPDAFDFQRHAYFQGLGATGFALGAPKFTAKSADAGVAPWDWRLSIDRARAAVSERLRRALPGESGSIAAALITGDRSGISEVALEAIRASGLAHLLAISGLHIGLVAGLTLLIVRFLIALVEPLALRIDGKKAASVVAIVAAFSYMLLAGMTVPTQRAFLMGSVMLFAVLLDRRAISLRVVAFGAAVILLWRPESLVGPSFQMSFAAVVALVAVYEAWADRRTFEPPPAGRIDAAIRAARRYGLTLAVTSLTAGIATAPFAMFHFHETARLGLLANMLAVPIMGLWIMPSALATVALMPFGLEGLVAPALGAGIDMVTAIAGWVASLPGSVQTVPAFSVAALVAMAVGGLWIAAWRGPVRWAGVAGLCLGAVMAASERPPDMLVDRGGGLLAIRDSQGWRLVARRRDGFVRDVWARRLGVDRFLAGDDPGGLARCDAAGCAVRAASHRAVVLFDGADLPVECFRSTVVLTAFRPPRRCPSAEIVRSIGDLARQGGAAVWLGREVTIRTVRQARGERPWTGAPFTPWRAH